MRTLKKLLLICVSLPLMLSGCGGNSPASESESSIIPSIPGSSESTSSEDDIEHKIKEIYNLYLASGGDKSYEEWLESIKGDKGDPGKDGSTILSGNDAPTSSFGNVGDFYIDLSTWDCYFKESAGWIKKGNIKGPAGQDGQNGEDGQNGQNGLTPYIGGNGNWWIGETDLEIKAQGEQGPAGQDGQNGQDGKNGLTPYIGENGNWWIGETDIGIKAQGIQGNPGENGQNGRDGKSAYEIYCEKYPDYTKSEAEWLDDLVNGRLGNKEKYPVTFNSNGGTDVPSQVVNKEDKIVKPVDPIKEGYTLVDWLDDNNDHWVFNGYTVTSDINLNAKWNPNNYVITLDTKGGEVTSTSLDVTYNEHFDLPVATKEGYSFVGWYLNNEKVASGDYLYTTNITLTAKWKDLYTIYFDTNGGDKIDEIGMNVDTVTELPTPAKDGAIFLGWYLDNKLIDLPFVNQSCEDLYLIASWKETSGDYDYSDNGDGTATITGYKGEDSELVIPNKIRDLTVTKINKEVFKDNDSISKIILPDTITNIGDEAFMNMASLEEITFGNSLSTVGENVLSGTHKLHKVKISASNFSLLSLFDFDENNIPKNLDVVLTYNSSTFVKPSEGIFKRLTEKTSLNIELDDSWSEVPAQSFYECKYISTITLGSSVTSIYSYAFCNCSSLTSITIPDSVTYIGNWAFSNCRNLTSITIPNSVTSIGDYVFSDCSKLSSIIIPSSVTSIYSYAFCNCSSLTSITIPDSVTSIGDVAFYNCSNLTSVTIGNSVTSIGERAFSDCSNLTSITLPDSVTSIGRYTFYNCSSLHGVFYSGSKSKWFDITIGSSNEYLTNASIEYNSEVKELNYISTDKYSYVLTNDNRVYGFKIKDNTITSFDFENELPGLDVISLGDEAFYGCSKLSSITIPDSVTSIGSGAFSDCSNLSNTYVIISSIDDWLKVSGKNNLRRNIHLLDTNNNNEEITEVVIPNSVTSIDSYAFYGCSKLSSITIPNSVTSIGRYTFYNCSSLTSITIPNSVTSIGDYVFTGCSKLSSITIPSSVTSIGGDAFFSCSSLTSITIPDSVTSIGYQAFYNCSNLTSVTIGNSVTSIGERAFYYCSKLVKVYYKGNDPYTSRITNIGYDNGKLVNATWYYFTENGDSETTQGNWWYYDTDGITIIEKVVK